MEDALINFMHSISMKVLRTLTNHFQHAFFEKITKANSMSEISRSITKEAISTLEDFLTYFIILIYLIIKQEKKPQ